MSNRVNHDQTLGKLTIIDVEHDAGFLSSSCLVEYSLHFTRYCKLTLPVYTPGIETRGPGVPLPPPVTLI